LAGLELGALEEEESDDEDDDDDDDDDDEDEDEDDSDFAGDSLFCSPLESPDGESLFSLCFVALSCASFSRARFFVP
jgi:hypothetical protein